MKTTLNRFLSVALLTVSILLSSCEDGKDGKDGLNFTEARKYGNIIVTLEGKRPDNVAFTSTIDFPFSSVDSGEIGTTSGIAQNDNLSTYSLIRFLGNVNDVYQKNYINIDFQAITTNGVNRFTTNLFVLYTNILTSDNKYFEISNDDYKNFASTLAYKAYTYNATTGNLTFTIEFTVPAASNATGYDLKVKAVGDVTVLAEITAAAF